jgi:hypothetical protein
MKTESPWNNYATSKTAEIDLTWQTYTCVFKSNTTDENGRISFFVGNSLPQGSTLYLDSLSFKEET